MPAELSSEFGTARAAAASVAFAVITGLLLGFVTQRSAHLAVATNEALASSTGPWAVVAALIARRATSARLAVCTSTVCLACATIVFYASGGPAGGPGIPAFWLALIVTVGPALGIVGRLSNADGITGSLAIAVIAGWLLGEAAHTALAYTDTARWLVVFADSAAVPCWLLAARGPRHVIARALLPASVVAIVLLIVVEHASRTVLY